MKNHTQVFFFFFNDISYKILISAKPLYSSFNKLGELIRIFEGIRYLVLFGSRRYDATFNKVIYLRCQKSGITYVISQDMQKAKLIHTILNV